MILILYLIAILGVSRKFLISLLYMQSTKNCRHINRVHQIGISVGQDLTAMYYDPVNKRIGGLNMSIYGSY